MDSQMFNYKKKIKFTLFIESITNYLIIKKILNLVYLYIYIL